VSRSFERLNYFSTALMWQEKEARQPDALPFLYYFQLHESLEQNFLPAWEDFEPSFREFLQSVCRLRQIFVSA
jgi:hypothetical protein